MYQSRTVCAVPKSQARAEPTGAEPPRVAVVTRRYPAMVGVMLSQIGAACCPIAPAQGLAAGAPRAAVGRPASFHTGRRLPMRCDTSWQ